MIVQYPSVDDTNSTVPSCDLIHKQCNIVIITYNITYHDKSVMEV